MLTFGKTNTLLFAGLITMNVLQFFTHVSGWWYLGWGLMYMIVISIGSFRVDSQFHFPVICRNREATKGVALTFDDGPDPVVTPRILEVLEKHNVHAAFFMIAHKAEQYPELVQKVLQKGHIIGSHTYSHSHWFDMFTPRRMHGEFMRSTEIFRQILDKTVRWFRPPFGVTNPMMKRGLRNTGLIPIGWSIRSLDTVIKDPEKVIRRVMKAETGDIILLHENRRDMPDILNRILEQLKQKGLPVVHPEDIILQAPYSETGSNPA